MRVKGQHVSVNIIVDGETQTAIDSVTSFDMEIELDLTSEGFLGELTNRRDETYTGVNGSLEIQFQDEGVFNFFNSIVQRSKEQLGSIQINIGATINMPNGQRPKINIIDAHFGNIGISFSGRTDFATVSMNYGASDFVVS